MQGWRWALIGLAVLLLGLLGTAVLRQRRGPLSARTPARPVPPCRQCHAHIARTYAHVGMARSFQALTGPTPTLPAAAIRHARSGRLYEVLRRGDRLVPRPHQVTPAPAPRPCVVSDAT